MRSFLPTEASACVTKLVVPLSPAGGWLGSWCGGRGGVGGEVGGRAWAAGWGRGPGKRQDGQQQAMLAGGWWVMVMPVDGAGTELDKHDVAWRQAARRQASIPAVRARTSSARAAVLHVCMYMHPPKPNIMEDPTSKV